VMMLAVTTIRKVHIVQAHKSAYRGARF
jgi:hypothetical protein